MSQNRLPESHDIDRRPTLEVVRVIQEQDALVAACVRHGIYLTTDLYVSRRVPWRTIGVEEGGIYHSGDEGETWESLNEGLYWDVHTVVPDAEGARLYATTGRGFYRSDDGGRHWRYLMTGLDRRYTVPLVASQQRPGRLYTAAAAGPPPSWRQGANAAVYRSDDGGERWVRLERGFSAEDGEQKVLRDF